jgi:hypothetical protein
MVSKSSKSVDVGMPSKISFWKGLNRCIILSFEIKLWASIISADILIFEKNPCQLFTSLIYNNYYSNFFVKN